MACLTICRERRTLFGMDASDLRALRARLGLTQSQFSLRIGVTKRAVQHWEAGTRKISAPVERLILTMKVPQSRGEGRI